MARPIRPVVPDDTEEEHEPGSAGAANGSTVPAEPEDDPGAESDAGDGGDGGDRGAATDDPPATGEAVPSAATPPTDFRTVIVSTVTVDLPNQHATVVLRESESPRRHLSFAVGIPDAVALSHALRRITTPRPLTHELVTEVLEGAEVDLVAVRLVGRRGTVYFAELDVRSRAGRRVHSCRPSDGLTLALLQKVPTPILVDRRLLEEKGDVDPTGS